MAQDQKPTPQQQPYPGILTDKPGHAGQVRRSTWQPRPSAGKLILMIILAPFVFIGGELAGVWLFQETFIGMDLGAMIGLAVASAVAVLLFGGVRLLRGDGRAFGKAWYYCWPALVPTVLFTGIALLGSLGTDPLSTQWGRDLVYAGFLCLFIGISEEIFFRGFVFNGLLAGMGRSRAGVVWAAVLASLIFGAAHVDWTASDFSNDVVVAQVVLKILQTGLYSFLLCAVVLKTRNLWGVALLHAVDDFLIFGAMVLFTPLNLQDISYVDATPETGNALVAFYLISCIVYIPLLVIAINIFRKTPMPGLGSFIEPARAEQLYSPAPPLRNEYGTVTPARGFYQLPELPPLLPGMQEPDALASRKQPPVPPAATPSQGQVDSGPVQPATVPATTAAASAGTPVTAATTAAETPGTPSDN